MNKYFYPLIEDPFSNNDIREGIKVLKSKYSQSIDFSLDVLPNFVNKIYCYETKKNYVDIGTPENYKRVNNF